MASLTRFASPPFGSTLARVTSPATSASIRLHQGGGKNSSNRPVMSVTPSGERGGLTGLAGHTSTFTILANANSVGASLAANSRSITVTAPGRSVGV